MNELDKLLKIDINEIPEADVSRSEKKQMKKRLLQRKRTSSWLIKLAVAASIFTGVSAVSVIAFPSFASQIPILQNVVSYFDEEQLLFNHFSEVAQPLNLTETSNGSTVTIEEAVYDGTSVTITFALQTETELGESPISTGFLEAAGAGGSGGSITMDKVNDNTYAGMITMAPDFRNQPPNTLKFSWEPIAFEDVMGGPEVTGDWSFNFKLKAIDSNPIHIGRTIDFEGGRYLLDELSLTKLSTVLRLNVENVDEDNYITEWHLTDNLGNTYPMHFGTGGTSGGIRHQQFTFEALDPDATSIAIVPTVTYVENPEDAGVKVDAPSIQIELE